MKKYKIVRIQKFSQFNSSRKQKIQKKNLSVRRTAVPKMNTAWLKLAIQKCLIKIDKFYISLPNAI